MHSSAAEAGAPTDEFERFYEAEYGRVLMLAWTLSGDRGRAEELTQDAFEATFRRWAEVRGYEGAAVWVRRVVANKSASRVRRLGAERRALGRVDARRDADGEVPTLPDEQLWRAVRTLPLRQREAVALRYVEDRSVAEIAQILDIAEGTVKAHLHRGRQALEALLTSSHDGEDG